MEDNVVTVREIESIWRRNTNWQRIESGSEFEGAYEREWKSMENCLNPNLWSIMKEYKMGKKYEL